MNEDTKKLLKECNSGCKMATSSVDQVIDLVKDENLRKMLDSYSEKHKKLGDRCHTLLNQNGKAESDPPKAAKAFSWISTEFKLVMDSSDREIAKIMENGCNMGITSVSGYINEYGNADEQSRDLARRLVSTEQNFASDLLSYL